MMAGLGQIAGLAVGVAVIGGVTIAIIGKEVVKENQTITDKAESSLISLGYFSEGMLKGVIVSVPVCALVLIGLNVSMKAQNRLVGGV